MSHVTCSVLLSYRRDVRLVWGTMVVGHEGVELQGVELKAGVVDVLHILHGVFVHGEQGGSLGNRQKKIFQSASYLVSNTLCISCYQRCISLNVSFKQ